MHRGHLAWPFFEMEHRILAAQVDGWLSGTTLPYDDTDVDALTRAWASALANTGFLRQVTISPFGGAKDRLDARSLCLIRERLAYHHPIADFTFAMQGLGSAPITLFGSVAQKDQWLPAVTHGESLAAFALSEEVAGSDVAAITTRAVRDGDGYIINGEKMWISNGGIAGFYTVFARTSDTGGKGLSVFIVPGDAPGVERAERIVTSSPHPLARMRFCDVRVSTDAIIGEEGDGFRIAMSVLDLFRPSVAAAATGFARRALDEMLKHAKSREIFGGTLADLQLTQSALASSVAEIDASALLLYRAAWATDVGAAKTTRESASAKWFATEAAGRITDRAVQLFGGRGVVVGEIVERLYRDVRALRIYEGASEIQQIVIARNLLAEDYSG